MSYIGNQITSNAFIADVFSGTGAQTVFSGLTFAPASTAAIAVFVAGSYQSPTSYSVSGTTLTFNSAPAAGTSNIQVLHLGTGATTIVPSDGSVNSVKLADGAVTGPKLGLTAINANNIVNGTITGAKIAATTITGDLLSTSIIRANNIASGSITGDTLAGNIIRANNIVAGSITGDILPANVIRANNIVAGQITGNLIGSTAINANNIVDGSITSIKLAPGAGGVSNSQLSIVTAGLGFIPDSPASITPYKILGQVQVGGATFGNTTTNVYVVPASTQTVVKTIAITNQSANNVVIDFYARLGTQALGNQHFIVRAFNLTAADTLLLEPNITMNASSILAANIIGANANTSNVTVNTFGVEMI